MQSIKINLIIKYCVEGAIEEQQGAAAALDLNASRWVVEGIALGWVKA